MNQASAGLALLLLAGAGATGLLAAPSAATPTDAPVPPVSSAPAPAVPPVSSAPAPAVPPTLLPVGALLEQAVRAGRDRAYAGTQHLVTWTGGQSIEAVVDVAHRPGVGSLIRANAPAGGADTEVFERDADSDDADSDDADSHEADSHEADSHAAKPDKDTADRLTTATTPRRAGPAAAERDGRSPLLLLRNYDLSVVGAQDCVGRPAAIVEARQRATSDGTVAGRLWIDIGTGLVLRREVFDLTGRAVRTSAFVSLDLDRPPALPDPLPRPVAAAGTRLDAPTVAGLRGSGWVVPAELPHHLELYDVRRLRPGGDSVLHLSYTDGLSVLSLFQQKGRLAADELPGWRRERIAGVVVHVQPTPPQRVVWASRDRVYTVIADAPPDTVQAAVASLPHSPASNGVLSRLGRGLARVGSWLNPFG